MTRLLSPSRCRALGACLATALLAGCGGGHDDDRFDVRAGLRNLMTQPHALTLTGSSGTVSYTLTLTNTPQQAGTYCRVTADLTVIAVGESALAWPWKATRMEGWKSTP